MNFYFCETCGKRLTDADLEQGAARNKKLKGVYCQSCAVGVMTMESMPLTDEEARRIAAQNPDVQRKAAPIRSRTDYSSARGKPEGAPAKPAPRTQATAYVGAGMVVLMIGITAFVMNRKSLDSVPVKPQSRDAVTQPSAPVAIAAAKPSVTVPPPQPEKPAGVARASSEPIVQVAPPPEEPKEPTPKELYDQAVREGKIKPYDPATANKPAVITPENSDLLSISSPAANDPAWKSLFNGKDLKGWTIAKGNWKVEDGVIVGTAIDDTGARLDSEGSFGDFELICQLWLADSKYSTVKARDTRLYVIGKQKQSWCTLRIVAVGGSIETTLDGVALVPAEDQKSDNRSGPIRIFVANPFMAKMKDVRWRELKVGDLTKH
jgi:DNA-directed RNA polymerase subunit RPC12/RpoP